MPPLRRPTRMLPKSVLDRFVQSCPAAVMVRATLENLLRPERLNRIFADAAHRQYLKKLVFSDVVAVMSAVATRTHQSVHCRVVGDGTQARSGCVVASLRAGQRPRFSQPVAARVGNSRTTDREGGAACGGCRVFAADRARRLLPRHAGTRLTTARTEIRPNGTRLSPQ